MDVLTAVFVSILGLCVGSFLNVCIYRIPVGESVVSEPSHCPACWHRLGVLDLFPVLSYLFLRGRCRHCGEGISSRYPLVELLTGLMFLISFLVYRPEMQLVAKYAPLFAVLIVVTFIDYDHQIIPNRLVVAILLWGLTWQVLYPEIGWLVAGGGALLGGGLLLLAAVLSRGGMGGGDIKLMFAAGFILGLPLTALALFIAFLTGALFGLALMLWKKVGRKQMVPFGPFLCLGIAVALLWGQGIVNWYLNLIFF